jgi:hypothetical protein
VLIPSCLFAIGCVGAFRSVYWGRRPVSEPGFEDHPRVVRLLDWIGSRGAQLCIRLDAIVSRTRVAVVSVSGLYAAAFFYYAAYSIQTKGFLIMPDELQYLKLADSIGHDLQPEIRGELFSSYNSLYPLLMAPVTRLFPSVPDAFLVIHIINALAMASAVFPTYLLTRSVIDSRLAGLAAGALAVAGPWLLFTNLIMTESVAYPAFMWALLGIQRALVAPSPRRDLAALVGIGFAVFARTQFVVLLPTMVGAILLHRGTYAATVATHGARLRAFRLGLAQGAHLHRAALAPAALLATAVVLIAAVWSAQSVLGIYGAVADPPGLLPSGLVVHMAKHFMHITVALAFLPVVLSVAFAATALGRPASRSAHAYAWLLVLTVFAIVFQSSWFNLSFAHGDLNDRYLFYVAGPLAVGMVAALDSPSVSWRAVAVAACAITALVPLGSYSLSSNWFGAPSLALMPALNDSVTELNERLRVDIGLDVFLITGALILGALAVTLMRSARRPVAIVVLSLPTMLIGAVEGQYLYGTSHWRVPSPKVLAETLGPQDPGNGNWIDEHVPTGDSVALMSSPALGFIPPWRDEFWNKAVDNVYRLHNPTRSAPEEGLLLLHARAFHHHELRINTRTGAVQGIPRVAMSSFVVMSGREVRFSFRGARRLTSHRGRARFSDSSRRDLMRVPVPYRASWLVRNVLDNAWTARGVTRLLIFPGTRRAERRRVAISLDGGKRIGRPRDWSVRGPGVLMSGRIGPGGAKQTARFFVCVPASSGPTVIRIRIAGYTKRGHPTRVGLLLRNLRVSRTGPACGRKSQAGGRAPAVPVNVGRTGAPGGRSDRRLMH